VVKAKTQVGTGGEFPAALAVGEKMLQRPSLGACGRGESLLGVTAGISMVELEFAIVEFMICSLKGGTPQGTPPMKDGSFSKQRSCGKSIL
jgi:hypothetical protein